MDATLKDIERELWLRMRNSGDIIWTTANKQSIPLKDMELSHLINTYNYLNKKNEENWIEACSLDIC